MVQVCQWLAKGQQFSPGTMVSSTNKTDCHNITEILLKVALNTITLTLLLYEKYSSTVIFQLRFWGRYWGRISAPVPMRKRLFYSPISWGEIPNCLVIKLLVKIGNESFFKWKWKSNIFTFMTWFLFVLIVQSKEIQCTRYREPVQYIGSFDLLKVLCTGLR